MHQKDLFMATRVILACFSPEEITLENVSELNDQKLYDDAITRKRKYQLGYSCSTHA